MLAPFFDGMDIEQIKSHQRDFMAIIIGQKADYTGRDLREAHRDLVHEKGLNDTHFGRTAQHLRDTFDELGLPDDVASTLIKIVDAMRPEVLDR